MNEATTLLKASDKDTPREHIWTEYNRRKAKLFREYGHGPEYDRALRDLIDELGV
jgi:hypothetical protein